MEEDTGTQSTGSWELQEGPLPFSLGAGEWLQVQRTSRKGGRMGDKPVLADLIVLSGGLARLSRDRPRRSCVLDRSLSG